MNMKKLARSLVAAALAAGLAPSPAIAGVAIIRDAEIEQLLREYTAPIFRAAGISSGAAKVILVGDRSFNAFVADGQKIFVNVGALIETRTPNEMIGILAHECGHIAGAHLVRLHQELANAQILSIAGMLASAGGIAAQTLTSRNGRSQVGMDQAGMIGVLTGPQELVRRSLLSYQRTQESAADRAGVKFMTATGQSAKGMLMTFERFSSEALFKTESMDPYLISHPLPTERISNLQQAVAESPFIDRKDPPALQARHDLMRAKLLGFVADQAEIARRYPVGDASLPARYAQAISAYRFGRLDQALRDIDGLISAQPGNPYFHELKGQALLESGKAETAIAPLRRAASMAPQGTPIRVLLGHALVAAGTKSHDAEAIRILEETTRKDPDSAEGFQYLALAYDREGDIAHSQLASAEALFVSGQYVEARTQAKRAQDRLTEKSPAWLKTQDILNYRPPDSD